MIIPLVVSIIISVRLMFICFVWVENQNQRAWSIVKNSLVLTKGKTFLLLLLLIVIAAAASGVINSGITQIFKDGSVKFTRRHNSSYSDCADILVCVVCHI